MFSTDGASVAARTTVSTSSRVSVFGTVGSLPDGPSVAAAAILMTGQKVLSAHCPRELDPDLFGVVIATPNRCGSRTGVDRIRRDRLNRHPRGHRRVVGQIPDPNADTE